MYKTILESDSPTNLFSILSDKLTVLPPEVKANKENLDEQDASGIYQNYMYFFKLNKFIEINE
jgi:hypothetical protein